MDEITVANYRCFYHEQTARLAPLTLLVGENSTGKTSLMAMIRILEDLALGNEPEDFKREPYDLGSFDDIAHNRGTNTKQSDSFEAGFKATNMVRYNNIYTPIDYQFKATFGEKDTSPIAAHIHLDLKDCWLKVDLTKSYPLIRIATQNRSWNVPYGMRNTLSDIDGLQNLSRLIPFVLNYLSRLELDRYQLELERRQGFQPLPEFQEPRTEEARRIHNRLIRFSRVLNQGDLQRRSHRVFASAPVRSKPRRTYDPSRPILDPEGDYVPMYLANISYQRGPTWNNLKDKLQEFGKTAGLFDEISIKQLGKKHSEPFQLQIRKFGNKPNGPSRNLIDVGYGVSQVLPVITELLREDAPTLFLLQQPEIHLHPSAQAALGSLLCQIAKPDRQLVVETHSDYLLDRIRIDVRDKKTNLKPDDISILFFERNNLEVVIHSLRIDEEGNIIGAPPNYRNFFRNEINNLLRF